MFMRSSLILYTADIISTVVSNNNYNYIHSQVRYVYPINNHIKFLASSIFMYIHNTLNCCNNTITIMGYCIL